jgi:hypothetical protein
MSSQSITIRPKRQGNVLFVPATTRATGSVGLPSVSIGSGGPLGRPVGIFNLYANQPTGLNAGTTGLNYDHSGCSANNVVARINDARSKGIFLLMPIPGSGHNPWLDHNPPGSTFVLQKWKDGVTGYKQTPGVVAALKAGVADGTVRGISMMDEPFHPDWGGVVTKAVLDTMADWIHSELDPSIPAGYAGGRLFDWRPTEVMHSVDFVTFQWVLWPETGNESNNVQPIPNAQAFLNGCLGVGTQSGVKITMGVNMLNGGYRIFKCINNVPVVCCPVGGTWPTGGTGDRTGAGGQLCLPTPQQIQDGGSLFIRNSAGFLGWQWDGPLIFNKQAYRDAMLAVKAIGDTLPRISLKRTSGVII